MDKKQNSNKFKYIWSLVMVAIYLGIAYLLVFTKMFENISSTIRIAMAVLFTAYGIFRGYRLLRQDK